MDYSEMIYSQFAEPAAILTYKNGELKLNELNDRFLSEHWMNISKEEYINTDHLDKLDDENYRLLLDGIRKCVDTGNETEVETWRDMISDCCGVGKICLRSRLILIDKKDDEATVCEIIRNITNERRIKEELDDVEYRYKSASEQINIYNWEYIIATKEMRPCYRCMRDLGLPAVVANYPEPAIDAGIFPPDYADMYRDMMKKIDAGAPELEADIPLTVGRVPFRIKYTTEFDENGKPVKAFGSATLISETELGHIKIDNQIIASLAEEYSFICMADFISDSVRLIKENDILPVKAGSTCGEMIETIKSKLHDTPIEQKKNLSDVISVRTQLFKDCEQREFVYKDESQNRWIRINIHVIERGTYGVERLLVTSSVIDDLRAMKMDSDRLIAAQKKELEDRQTMLVAAIDEATRANQAKTDFFSNMSHDIRTPMSAITGFSRLAVEEINDKERLSDYLEKIVSAGDHLMNLINDILDMSRIESGKMEIQTSPLKLKDLLEKCADMVRVKMDENGLDFNVDIEKVGDDTVECDRLRVNQIILNLLSNAYKFTPNGGSVSLSARCIRQGKEKNIYEIRVKDTGIGMSKEFCEHIWEAYSRENSEKVHETQGTGLGMMIVKNIVNLMQGTIDVRSEPGKGTEFIIIMPLMTASEDQGESPESKAISDALSRNYEGVTLLVVDDNEINLKLADRVLALYGFNVIKENSALNAISVLKDSKPGDIDLVLMDVQMPVMDGLEATRRIRAMDDPYISNIPVIAMTANAFASDIQDCADAGMNAHISKPFIKEDLVTIISENLRKI